MGAASNNDRTDDETFQQMDSLFFSDIGSRPVAGRKGVDEMAMDSLLSFLQKKTDEFNHSMNGTKSPVLFNRFLAEHVLRLVRLFRQNQGHCVLLGMGGGGGKRTACRLAAFASNCTLMTLDQGREYDFKEWREELRSCMRKLAESEQALVIFITEAHLDSDAILNDLCSFMSGAEFPNLFSREEMQDIYQSYPSLVPVSESAHASANPSSNPVEFSSIVSSFFREKCRKNVKIVLSVNMELFRARLRVFPSILSTCSVNYLQDWPSETLRFVAARSMNLSVPQPMREGCVQAMEAIHQSLMASSSTLLKQSSLSADRPSNQLFAHPIVSSALFLDFCSLFNTLVSQKHGDLARLKHRYQSGLVHLTSASSEVQVCILSVH